MEPIKQFLLTHLSDLAAILALYLFGNLFLQGVVRRFADRAGERQPGGRRNKRARTAAKLIYGVGHAVLLLIILFWVLRIFNIDPTPILASAGIAGVALGFGAQTVVKDFLSGVFIIAENQYAIGDKVKINDFTGTVQHFSARSTVLQDEHGHKIFIPNGSIVVVTNMGDGAVEHEEK